MDNNFSSVIISTYILHPVLICYFIYRNPFAISKVNDSKEDLKRKMCKDIFDSSCANSDSSEPQTPRKSGFHIFLKMQQVVSNVLMK